MGESTCNPTMDEVWCCSAMGSFHIMSLGDMEWDTQWYRDGEFCGDRGVNPFVTGILVRIVPKNALVPKNAFVTLTGPKETPPPTFSPTFSPDFPARRGCGAGNGGLRYQVKLRTDGYGHETGIASYSFNEDYTALNEPVFQKTAPKSNTVHYFPSDDKYYCLEHNRCYYLEVTDSNNNGIESNEHDHPVYEAYIDNKRVAKGVPGFGKAAGTIFCTGNKCMDKKGFKITRRKKNCRKYVTGRPNAMMKKCNKIYKGTPIHVHCPATCGQRAGVGDCGWWKDAEEKLKERA